MYFDQPTPPGYALPNDTVPSPSRPWYDNWFWRNNARQQLANLNYQNNTLLGNTNDPVAPANAAVNGNTPMAGPELPPNGSPVSGMQLPSGYAGLFPGMSARQIDYYQADLAKHYGMNRKTAYQEALANTSHQREVADLQAAGLNPVLSATGGNGAAVFAPAASTSALGVSGGGGYRRQDEEEESSGGLIGGFIRGATSIAAGIVSAVAPRYTKTVTYIGNGIASFFG